MVIDVTGFGWSGSGAYYDLLKEYDELQFQNGVSEHGILYAVDGIRDLEFKMLEKHCRIFDSDVAIKRFLNLVDNLYNKKKVFENELSKEARLFVDSLTGIKFYSQSGFDRIYYGDKWYNLREWYNKYLHKVVFHVPFLSEYSARIYNYMRFSKLNEKQLSYDPENFLPSVQEFMNVFFSHLRDNSNKPLVTDHLFPPDSANSYMKYISEEAKCLIIRRDPRDTYILAKEIYRGKIPIPVDTVEDFVWFYKHTIEDTRISDSKDILSMNFEDLVYNYEETKIQLERFLKISNHTRPKAYFKPEVSINNTQLYLRYKKYSSDITYIEEHLPNSLYVFDDDINMSRNRVNSKIF